LPQKTARKTKSKPAPRPRAKNTVRKNNPVAARPALSHDLEKLLEEVCGLVDNVTHNEYALARLASQATPRIAAGGFTDAKQFWDEWVRKARPDAAPSYPTLTRWMRVARTWSEEQAGTFGFTKLEATLTWLNLKGLAAPKDPTTLRFDIPRSPDPVKFEECSVQDIEAAIHTLKTGQTKPLDAKTTQLEKDLEAALDGVMPHGAAHVRLVLHQEHPFFDFKSIPAELLADVCQAVLAKLHPHASKARGR
jgi:hypothetical protein